MKPVFLVVASLSLFLSQTHAQIYVLDHTFYQTPANWTEARSECQSHYRDLAVVASDQSELLANLTAILLLSAGSSPSGAFWIGGMATQQDESTWQWSWIDGSGDFYEAVYDGDTLSAGESEALNGMYTNWGAGLPDRGGTGTDEDCLAVTWGDENRWDDRECSERYQGFLCGPAAPMPTSAPTPISTVAPTPISTTAPTPAPTPLPQSVYGFTYHAEAATWDDALQECVSAKQQLVSIHDLEENAALVAFMSVYQVADTSVWLGAQRNASDLAMMHWSDDSEGFQAVASTADFPPWATDEPAGESEYENENCLSIAADGEWADDDCETALPYICAPVRWVLEYEPKLSWDAARQSCVDMGGDLVSIHSQEENDALTEFLQRRTHLYTQENDLVVYLPVYIGLTTNEINRGYNGEVQEDVSWTWSDSSGTITYKTPYGAWNEGEPNNWENTGEDCAVLIASDLQGDACTDHDEDHLCDGGWFDSTCSTENPYVCAFVPDPTPMPTSVPTPMATEIPTLVPTAAPTAMPTAVPTPTQTGSPTPVATAEPTPTQTESPTAMPTAEPTPTQTESPTAMPTAEPTQMPTAEPNPTPTGSPTLVPSPAPTATPTGSPTPVTTGAPSPTPTGLPTSVPSAAPTPVATDVPTASPTQDPTAAPSPESTLVPSPESTDSPTPMSTSAPTPVPTPPTDAPTAMPTPSPTLAPTSTPTAEPTAMSSLPETNSPTPVVTDAATPTPTLAPTSVPTAEPTAMSSLPETNSPTPVVTGAVTDAPTSEVTDASTSVATDAPTPAATDAPNPEVTDAPTPAVTDAPNPEVTDAPTPAVTDAPNTEVTDAPTPAVTDAPNTEVTDAPTPAVTDAPIPVPSDVLTRPLTSSPTPAPTNSSAIGGTPGIAAEPDSAAGLTIFGDIPLYAVVAPAAALLLLCIFVPLFCIRRKRRRKREFHINRFHEEVNFAMEDAAVSPSAAGTSTDIDDLIDSPHASVDLSSSGKRFSFMFSRRSREYRPREVTSPKTRTSTEYNGESFSDSEESFSSSSLHPRGSRVNTLTVGAANDAKGTTGSRRDSVHSVSSYCVTDSDSESVHTRRYTDTRSSRRPPPPKTHVSDALKGATRVSGSGMSSGVSTSSSESSKSQEFTPILTGRTSLPQSVLNTMSRRRDAAGSRSHRQTLSRSRNGFGEIEMQHNKPTSTPNAVPGHLRVVSIAPPAGSASLELELPHDEVPSARSSPLPPRPEGFAPPPPGMKDLPVGGKPPKPTARPPPVPTSTDTTKEVDVAFTPRGGRRKPAPPPPKMSLKVVNAPPAAPPRGVNGKEGVPPPPRGVNGKEDIPPPPPPSGGSTPRAMYLPNKNAGLLLRPSGNSRASRTMPRPRKGLAQHHRGGTVDLDRRSQTPNMGATRAPPNNSFRPLTPDLGAARSGVQSLQNGSIPHMANLPGAMGHNRGVSVGGGALARTSAAKSLSANVAPPRQLTGRRKKSEYTHHARQSSLAIGGRVKSHSRNDSTASAFHGVHSRSQSTAPSRVNTHSRNASTASAFQGVHSRNASTASAFLDIQGPVAYDSGSDGDDDGMCGVRV